MRGLACLSVNDIKVRDLIVKENILSILEEMLMKVDMVKGKNVIIDALILLKYLMGRKEEDMLKPA